MLLPVFPHAFVLATISPVDNTVTFLLVIDVLTNVTSTVRPQEFTLTVHFIAFPFAFIDTTVEPFILPLPFDNVVLKLTVVDGTVWPNELSMAVLLPMLVISFIVRTIRPAFYSESMLYVFEPFSSVAGSVLVKINTFAVGLIIEPFSFVDISIGMY